MGLGAGEERAIHLALAGDDPVLRLLREQAEPENLRVERHTRSGLPRRWWGRSPDLMVSLDVRRRREISIGERPGFSGLYDLVVFPGRAAVSVTLGVDRGYLRYVFFTARPRKRLPDPLPEFEDWAYKQCGHWDANCLHEPPLAKERLPIDIDARYPKAEVARPEAPRWLSSVQPGPLPNAEALSALRGSSGELPEDYTVYLEWTDGSQLGDFDLFGAGEAYLLDVSSLSTMRLLAIGSDTAGDLIAIAVGEHPDGGSGGGVYLVTHDPPQIERLAPSFRTWVRAAVE